MSCSQNLRSKFSLWVAGWLALGCAPENQYQPPPPPPVTVAAPIQKTVNLYVVENGQTEAVDRAEVRARVQGFLEEIRFEEGQEVAANQVLYIIEQREYRAARDAAKADLMITEVAVARTQSEFKRQEQLLSKNATPETKWEQAKAEYEGSIATRDKARAALDRAELDLEYTEVKANIAGEVSETFVKKGNLVADGTLLAAITKLDPIAAKFNVSERYVNQLQRQATAGERERRSDLQSIAADLQRDGDQGYPFRGNLTYIDTTGIDQSTGTLMIKAEFPNADKRILPGNSVRVRVPVGVLEDALLIPERAVAADQAGRYVFVVTADNKAERRNVQLGPNYGRLVVVEEGLQAGDKVIVDGLQRVRGGAQVTPSPLDLVEEADALDVAIHQDADAETADDDGEADGDGGNDAPPAENEPATTERAATSADEPPPDASTQPQ